MEEIRKTNTLVINTIIEQLERIKNSDDILNCRINLDTNMYIKRDHTKSERIETKRNGLKTVITIEEGKLIDEEITHIGYKILRDDTNYDLLEEYSKLEKQ